MKGVVDCISDYLLHTNVQLGADYSVSVASTTRVAEGLEAVRELFNAASVDEISMGSSSTMLAENVARAIDSDVLDDEEIIVTGEHEGESQLNHNITPFAAVSTDVSRTSANAGPWKKLAGRRGLTLKYWHAAQIQESPNNPYAVSLQLADLLPLITSKTRLVAFTGCSNVLGRIVPIKEVTAAVRARAKELGARKVEVRDWDVDYCFFSVYKACFLSMGLCPPQR